MTPTPTAAPKTPWWMILIHLVAVAAATAPAIISIYNKNPTTTAQATETGQLISGLVSGLFPPTT